MKKRFKWEVVICTIIAIIILVSYIIAMEHINFIDNNYNSFRLYWIIVFVCMVMITGDLLLYNQLKKIYRKGEK
jgi:hypothetical protein